MFKNLYNNLINLNLNFKTNSTSNLFTFLKKSFYIKNYSNYLNFYVSIFNQLKLKTVQTTFFVFSIDNILPYLNLILVLWVCCELFMF